MGGEVLHQLELLVGEGADFLTKDCKGTDHLVVLEHRNHEKRADVPNLDSCDCSRIAFDIGTFRRKVGDVYRLLRFVRAHDRSIFARLLRSMSEELHKRLGHIQRSYKPHSAILNPEQYSEFCFA